jgi:hypothetical protein
MKVNFSHFQANLQSQDRSSTQEQPANTQMDPKKDSMKKKQICITDKNHRCDIIKLFVVHLHWHPFIHTLADAGYDATVDMKVNWKEQVIEMHDLCKKLDESWAWEYLWRNWYRPDRWNIWARAVCKEIPIINSNALVEALWATFKRRYLRRFARPKLEFTIEILMDNYLPNRVMLVKAHRNLQEDPVWYNSFQYQTNNAQV